MLMMLLLLPLLLLPLPLQPPPRGSPLHPRGSRTSARAASTRPTTTTTKTRELLLPLPRRRTQKRRSWGPLPPLPLPGARRRRRQRGRPVRSLGGTRSVRGRNHKTKRRPLLLGVAAVVVGPLPFFGLKCCLFGSSSRCFLSRQDLVHHRRPFALFAFRGYIQPQP